MDAQPKTISSTHKNEGLYHFQNAVVRLLHDISSVEVDNLPRSDSPEDVTGSSIIKILEQISMALKDQNFVAEGVILQLVVEKTKDKIEFGGLGLEGDISLSEENVGDVLFLVEAWLTSLKSKDLSRNFTSTIPKRSPETRPMTLAQKIFSQHVVGDSPTGGLSAGDVVRVGIDWILASELSWQAMAATHEQLGSPGIWRNDRFWLAGDHVVHPDILHVPKIKAMVDISEKAKRDFKMTEYQGMNYTIMHTEFVRERAEPGMLCLGSDSHSCSAGAVGCLSIGLGTADVMLALSLGETWFKIPESILIEFVGKPLFGMTGKDVILYILKELKRNTVAAERIVEFTGEGVKYLSTDARFAICNMCTEFGAITGVFQPDCITKYYVSRRRRRANKVNSIYFQLDEDADYAGRFTIDLSKVEPSMAVYPEPDNVVPVSKKAGMHLDGVFIGACTTTEEELVLAGLVLKVGLKQNLPLAKGRRHYVPGSLPIVEKLKELGLLEVYEAAGFTRGPPGCSFCVGLSAEKAAAGETWLSSQNRNFKNRMGPGSFGSVSTAVVCAASSFSMKITDPAPFLSNLDAAFLEAYKGQSNASCAEINYVEPALMSSKYFKQSMGSLGSPTEQLEGSKEQLKEIAVIKSKTVTLGDFIDTDALAPGPTLTTCVTDEEFGEHALEHTNPEFRKAVRTGKQVVVAGKAFGVGSSREVAVSALKGVGIKAVIARSFAFIYGRNQPSLGMLGITMADEEFFELGNDGVDITIDVPQRQIHVGGKQFDFKLSEIEYNLTKNKGISETYKMYGKSIWEQLTKSGKKVPQEIGNEESVPMPLDDRLEW